MRLYKKAESNPQLISDLTPTQAYKALGGREGYDPTPIALSSLAKIRNLGGMMRKSRAPLQAPKFLLYSVDLWLCKIPRGLTETGKPCCYLVMHLEGKSKRLQVI